MSNSLSTTSMCLRTGDPSFGRSPATGVTSAVPTVSVISVPERPEQEESNLEAHFEFAHSL